MAGASPPCSPAAGSSAATTRPLGPVSHLVELGEFVLVVDGDRAVVVDHRAAGRGDVRQDLGVHLSADAAQFADG